MREKIINSALWAAYGDALGFMSELADENMLIKRTGDKKITNLNTWKRQIGGRYGAIVILPQGAYSDDTQLRLSTSRAINNNYHFGIHEFSKIELPVWQCYALGAGRGSKLAASSLSKRNTVWFNNFYSNDKTNYIHAGGNGACMRIQPHVWACPTPTLPQSFLPDVIKNSITTHGHARAIAGAVFHALSLAHVINSSKIPSIDDLKRFNDLILDIPKYINEDQHLNTIWKNQIELSLEMSINDQYSIVHKEINTLLSTIEQWYNTPNKTYKKLAKALDLYTAETRGSGTLTSVAASATALLIYDIPANQLMLDIVNELWTDTDSIATMVGAIIGIALKEVPPHEVQDQAYIIEESDRIFKISQGIEVNNYDFSNSLDWKSPTSNLDFITTCQNKMVLYPFGELTPRSDIFNNQSEKNRNFNYQWVESSFGQSFLVKKRDISLMKPSDTPCNMNEVPQQILFEVNQNTLALSTESNEPLDIDKLTTLAISSHFSPEIIGKHIITISNSSLGTNGVIAYTAIISKAIIARKKRNEKM